MSPSLPLEIIWQIIDDLANLSRPHAGSYDTELVQAFLSLCLVNRFVSRYAIGRLYDRVAIRSDKQLEALVTSGLHYAPRIRSLTLHLHTPPEAGHGPSSSHVYRLALVDRIPDLERLTLIGSFAMHWKPENYELQHSLSDLSQLRELVIAGDRRGQFLQYFETGNVPQSTWPNLRRLVLQDVHPSTRPYVPLWKRCPNLELLAISWSVTTSAVGEVDELVKFFSHLQRLVLVNRDKSVLPASLEKQLTHEKEMAGRRHRPIKILDVDLAGLGAVCRMSWTSGDIGLDEEWDAVGKEWCPCAESEIRLSRS